MLKGIGLCCLFLSGTGIGWMASATLRKRVRTWKRLEDLMAHLISKLRYTAAPIDRVLEELHREDTSFVLLRTVCEHLKEGASPGDAWIKAIGETPELRCLTAEDKAWLKPFGQGLGRTDLEGQLTYCAAFREGCADRLCNARQAVSAKGKLYGVLGMAGGIGAVLLWW